MENHNTILLPPKATKLINEVLSRLTENKRNPQTELIEVAHTPLLKITYENRPNHGETAAVVKRMEAIK